MYFVREIFSRHLAHIHFHCLSLVPQALSGEGRIFSRAVDLLNIQPMLTVDYTATDASSDVMASLQSSMDDLGVSSAVWDPRQSAATGALTKADLVICNCVLNGISTVEMLENLASATKEGGFVLLHTLLKGDTLGETLAFLTSQNNQKGLMTQVQQILITTKVMLFGI